jgi:hypothetical protein
VKSFSEVETLPTAKYVWQYVLFVNKKKQLIF